MKLTIIAAIVSIVLLEPFDAQGQTAVSIEAGPGIARIVGNKKAYIRVIIRIKPQPDNRNLVFRWESPDGDAGRKDRQLDGEDSPTIFDTGDEGFFGKHGLQLSEGHYTLSATVERSLGDNPRANLTITVTGGDDGDHDR